jgi:anti-sigma regulatory factor (Ser/Thr protein kinase)
VASLPHHVATVRMFVSTVARSVGLDVETIDDAKLAASEIATAIVTAGDLPFITVRAIPTADGVTLMVGPWRGGLGADDDFGPIDIAQALFEGTTVEGEFVVLPIEASGPDD